MPESILQQKIYPWDGAFDATKHPSLISARDVVDSENIVYTTYSTKKKRPGISELFFPTPPSISKNLGGIDFWRLGVQYVVFYDGITIWAVSPATNTWDNIGINYALPVDAVVSFQQFQGLLIICFDDGQTSPKAWTGTGLLQELSDTAPNGGFCRVWLNKLWMPDPDVPGRLLHSSTGTVDFTGGDSGTMDLDPNDGDPEGLTAIFPPFFSRLYVTKRFSVYKIERVVFSDVVVFSVSKISDGIGCNSHNAVAAGPKNIFFPSDEGVHYFVSTDKISEIDTEDFSLPVQPLWREQTNFKRARYMQGVYDRDLKSYLLIYPSFSRNYPNDVWGYSLVARKWYRWPSFEQTAIFRYTDRKTRKVKTVVGSQDGRLGYLDATKTSDYGKPINIAVQTGIICPSASPDEQYTFQCIAPIFVPQLSGKFSITYKIDGRVIETLTFDMTDDGFGNKLGEDFILGKSILGGLPQVAIDKRTVKGQGMMYELYIEHEGIGDDNDGFEMLGILTDIDRVSKAIRRTVA